MQLKRIASRILETNRERELTIKIKINSSSKLELIAVLKTDNLFVYM